MIFTITAVTATRLRSLGERLHPIYRDCFGAPPRNETDGELAGFPDRLIRDTHEPGAYGVVAFRGGEVAGAVYGWPSRTDDLPAAVVAPAVFVAELMVAPVFRGQGLGRRLLDRFTAGHPRAWLTTHAGTAGFYESAGWTRCAGDDPARVLYLRETPVPRSSSAGSVCGVPRTTIWAPPDRRPRTRTF
ncbi:GNAT family N-acetyltransferase [Actinoplanes sp. DH11]|uniref:GNAT family N-acetyltransferase n=1 Tax=Actinoplanes sp. DH11 TaxID=2857011 RepID=UPI001E36B488|nr:GNAT family N-acetyltransferase [Actinoplanes sp. DH11]